MALALGISKNRENLTHDERIELILDLTRRIELLDDLMERARERRMATDAGACLTEAARAELDMLSWV